MTDRITLTGLRARGFHGVLAAERELGQEFVVDLVLHVDTREAAAGDDLTATVNYAEVAHAAVEVLGGPPADLIETVAAKVAERVLAFPRVRAVDVTVHKPAAPVPVPFDDVAVRVHRAASEGQRLSVSPGSPAGPQLTRSAPGQGAPGQGDEREVVLALGANLGDARATLSSALTQLDRHARVRVVAVSPLVRSAAVVPPGTEPQPDYLNAVALIATALPPRELLALCQGIELAHGRVRQERWGARPLDLDVVAAGSLTWDDADLTVPHPRAHERPFVLAPLTRIAPGAVLPGHGPVADLAARLGEDGLEWVADDWWGAA